MTDIIAFYATDRWGTPKGRINGVSSATRTRKTTGTDTLTLIATTHLIKGDRIIFQDLRGIAHEYIITDYEQSRTDSYTATYYATNSIQELNLTFIEDKRVRGGNASAALTRLLEDTRWQVGTVQAGTLASTDISFYHVPALKALTDTCTTFGLEIQTELSLTADKTGIATRAVSLLNHVGSTDRRRYSFGRNLTDVKRRIDATDVYTRLYPYGKGIQSTDSEGNPTGGYGRKLNISTVNDGKTYIEDDTAVGTWGLIGPNGTRVHASTSMDYPDIDDATKLLEAARETLKTLTTPKVSYTATVAVLGIEGESRLGIGIGDDVSLYDETFTPALHVDGRVLEITDNILDPLSNATKITLGNITDSYTAKRTETDSKITELWNNSSTWNDAATLQGGYVDSIINGLNQQMNVTGGYVYMEPGTGITVYDKPRNQNPTMAIQLGGGYFRIADSKKSDGTWDWRTMGTGSGLVADIIVAGSIRGGASSWNLETGEISFKQGLITDQKNNTSWNLTTGDFRTNGSIEGSTISGGTIEGTDISGSTITGSTITAGTFNASTFNSPTINSGDISGSTITSERSPRRIVLDGGILNFYYSGSQTAQIRSSSGGLAIEYGGNYGIFMSSQGTSIQDDSGSQMVMGTGGISLESSRGDSIQLGSGGLNISTDYGSISMGSSGMSIRTSSYGQIDIGSGGLRFTNDQGWGMTLSASAFAINWAGGNRLSSGAEAGALYINGRKITTA